MGRFRERDRRQHQDFSGLDDLENEDDDRERHTGEMNFQGVQDALATIRSDGSETTQDLEEPEEALDDDQIDYDSIRSWANHAYFVNAHDHLDTPSGKELKIGISAHYEDMTDELMGYLKNGGVEGLHQYVKGELENDTHWANLVGLGLVEGEQDLSNLGEYVTDQVFEYSDRTGT